MQLALNYKDLRVYQAAFEVQQAIFFLTKSFPPEERYSLTDQIRRSSRSVGANIAEAWHKRMYVAHFASKLSDADAEQAETRHWLVTAESCGYVTPDELALHVKSLAIIGSMLGSMIARADEFCSKPQ